MFDEKRSSMTYDELKKFCEFITEANEAIVVLQNEMIVYVNPNGEKLFELPLEKLKGQPIINYVHPDDKELVINNYFKSVIGLDFPAMYTFRIISNKSKKIHIILVSTKQIIYNGEPVLLNIFVDITNIRKQEPKLMEFFQQINGKLKENNKL